MGLRPERLVRVVALAAALATVWPAAAQMVNVALGAKYSCNCGTLPGWDGLTDGIKDSDDPPGCWASDAAAQFPKIVTIDLGGLCRLSRVIIHNSTNGNTKQIQVAISIDGTHYDLLREYVFPPGAYQPLVHSFAPREARFVRISFLNTWGGGLGGDNVIYLREVEVFGTRAEKKTALEAYWATLSNERVFTPVPGWPAVRRYLAELSRPVTMAVICPEDAAEEIMGPGGWLAKGLAMLERAGHHDAWVKADLQVVSFPMGDPARLAAEWAQAFSDRPPDLIVLVPPPVGQADKFKGVLDLVADAHRHGASVMVCLPAPAGPRLPKARAAEYQALRRFWQVAAGMLDAGILDIAAAIAHRYALKELAAGGRLSEAQRSVVAEAWARAVR